MKRIFALSLSMLAAAVLVARADIIPSFVGVTASGGNTVWTYKIDVTTNQYVTTGNFFTIYDFGEFIVGTDNQPSGWTLTSSYVSTPPYQTNPPDDPNILNLTWTYTAGPNIPSNASLSPFEVTIAGITPSPVPIRDSRFGGEAMNSDNNTRIGNVGHISVPVIGTTVPEASTFSLLVSASGLMGVCWIVSRFRKRQLRA